MDELESLAVKEIIEEIENRKRMELESRRPPQRQIRPNKRFLGRTIVSVLQHNRRQYARERRNSSRKLKELERRNERSRSRDKESRRVPETSLEIYQPMDAEYFSNGLQVNLAMQMHFLQMNEMLKKIRTVPKKKRKKKQSEILTIDLTKKSKQTKEKKKKQKAHQNRIRSKKQSRKIESSSSASSSSSSSESSSSNESHSSALLIDLT